MSDDILKQKRKTSKPMLKPNSSKPKTRKPKEEGFVKVEEVFKVVDGQLIPIEAKVDLTKLLSEKPKGKKNNLWE